MRLRDAARKPDHTRKTVGSQMATYLVTTGAGETFRIHVKGRPLWALGQLMRAGLKGCTPITNPAPRWSSYVHLLRSMGVEIETIHEPHGGDYPGHHGRYILRSGIACGEGGAP